MRETEGTSDSTQDSIAEIVRAVSRRESPPRDHYEQVYSVAREAWQSRVHSRRRNRWLAMAASLAVVTGGGVIAYLVSTGDAGPAATISVAQGAVEYLMPDKDSWIQVTGDGQLMPAGTRIRTAAAGRTALQLTDGGSIRLNTNTHVMLGLDAIELSSGTVYFDSDGRPSSMAVRIRTAFGEVRDIGTQFEIDARDESLRIRVREGEVAVVGARAASDVTAVFGDEIELSSRGGLTRRSISADDDAWAWVEALASVPAARAQSILIYFRWIARETGKRLEFESDSVELSAEISSFGGDPRGLTPQQLLSAIAATSDFRYSMTSDGAILIGRN